MPLYWVGIALELRDSLLAIDSNTINGWFVSIKDIAINLGGSIGDLCYKLSFCFKTTGLHKTLPQRAECDGMREGLDHHQIDTQLKVIP